jgi:hypothetical protein
LQGTFIEAMQQQHFTAVGAQQPQQHPNEEVKKDRHIRILSERLSKIQHDFSHQKQHLHQRLLDQLHMQLYLLEQGTHPEFQYLVQHHKGVS